MQSEWQHDTGDNIELLLYLLNIFVQLQNRFMDNCLKPDHGEFIIRKWVDNSFDRDWEYTFRDLKSVIMYKTDKNAGWIALGRDTALIC